VFLDLEGNRWDLLGSCSSLLRMATKCAVLNFRLDTNNTHVLPNAIDTQFACCAGVSARVQTKGSILMRLWSLHPSLLDRVGLIALWREALLAQKVLIGTTKGYRHHPQLDRFRQSNNPRRAIASYLWSVADEAKERGYHFDLSKIAMRRGGVTIPVTEGQLAYELTHLKHKLRQRDPKRLKLVGKFELAKANPTFKAVEGPIEPWERTPSSMRARRI